MQPVVSFIRPSLTSKRPHLSNSMAPVCNTLHILYIQSLNNDELLPTVLRAFGFSVCNEATGRRRHSGVDHLMQTCPHTALQLRSTN